MLDVILIICSIILKGSGLVLTEVKNLHENGVLSDQEGYAYGRKVYNLDCRILHKMSDKRDSSIREQPTCKGIDKGWQVTIENGVIYARVNRVGNPYDRLPSMNNGKFTEAKCDIKSPNFLRIRLIPYGYSCNIITDSLKMISRPTKCRRIEISCIKNPEIGDVALAHFSSPDDRVFYGFGAELFSNAGFHASDFYNFAWYGDQCTSFYPL